MKKSSSERRRQRKEERRRKQREVIAAHTIEGTVPPEAQTLVRSRETAVEWFLGRRLEKST